MAAIEQGNPYAAFTLLRAYAENAAAILYLTDHPRLLDRFWKGPNLPIGKITNHAVKRFAAFKPIYAQLSGYAHPASRSMLTSFKVQGESRILQWRSAPAFRSEHDSVVACGWVVELAEATAHLLVEYGATWSGPEATQDQPDGS